MGAGKKFLRNKKKEKLKSELNTKITNPLENLNLSEEERIEQGLAYLTNIVNKKVKLQEIAGIKDSEVDAIVAAAVLLYQQDRVKEAEELFRGAILLNPSNALAHSGLGTVLTAQGKIDEALIELNQAISLNPDDIAAYVNRGEIYLQHAEFKAASEDLKKAIELDTQQNDPAANRARAIVFEMNKAISELQNQIDQGKEPELS